jgi:GMP synthase-like glutamine amidotransferase
MVFQHLSVEHPGIIRNFMDEDGVRWDAIELDDGVQIPDLDDYDAVISMGGPMDVWEENSHPWLNTEKAAIRRAVRELELPFLGICLGHQLLADALGGKVAPMSNPEVGILDTELTSAGIEDPLFAGLPGTYKSLQWHGAEVVEPPADSVVLAHSPACPIQAFRVGKSAYGLQYHIELTETTVSEWGQVPEYEQSLEQTLGPGALPRLNADANRHMADFNRTARIVYNNFREILKNT